MKPRTYLNVILTVNAVLLAGLVWTQIAGHPVMSTEAAAQSMVRPIPATGIPDAGDQRQNILIATRELKASVDATRKLIESGRLRVEVTNLDQIRINNE